jgi:prepilin-type N-terminal cleavage/methylation domain-containing protein
VSEDLFVNDSASYEPVAQASANSISDVESGPIMIGRNKKERGFTLVELMISVALLGLVMTVVFSLFSTTSDSMREADSLAHTLERTRFAVEQVSADLRSAGAFASPDSTVDPRVKPQDIGANSVVRVAGVASYNGWQNNDLLFPGPVQAAHTPSVAFTNSNAAGTRTAEQSGNGTAVSFDGFIVMGAIDFPQTFEIANLSFDGSGAATGGWIPATTSSLFKLLANNPFYTDIEPPDTLNPTTTEGANSANIVTDDIHNRMIRVMDREGRVQLGGVNSGVYQADNNASDGVVPSGNGILFTLDNNWVVQNSATHGQSEYGLERSTSGDEDIRYNAALVDAYWYHVEQDPEDPANFRLVRERLNANAVAEQLDTGPNAITPATLASTQAALDPAGNVSRDKVVITDRVVDFQVWFDCADTNGNVTGVPWQMMWPNPGGVSNAGTNDCMDPDGPPSFGQARMAHVRLSVRTLHERKDAPDNADAFFMNDQGEVDALVPLRYFNVYPEAPGSARVVTVQSDVDLTNFAMRNL